MIKKRKVQKDKEHKDYERDKGQVERYDMKLQHERNVGKKER